MSDCHQSKSTLIILYVVGTSSYNEAAIIKQEARMIMSCNEFGLIFAIFINYKLRYRDILD